MDIHAIALTLYAQLVGRHPDASLDMDARIALGREAYRYAEAFVAAKDQYIRALPVPTNEQGF
ncbi:hypothetical protein LJB71_05430 [Thermomonas sp. S9]|uniref:hypothetical protein n=1 Tax=unclassified Thermomonas TaxID=2633315 RepID=UPI001AC1B59D|nr:hypothetical protein [Thermomonas sp. S9]MBN8715619.1 hypothetical protein [Xanthomonadales bacterium]MBN8794497.1 hypothetical protein [Stenotrophomonas nitritireducens]MCR6495726.1 hypothetical protein [Thermomonas sp. S9]